MDPSTKILTKQYLDIQTATAHLQKQINELREQKRVVESRLIQVIQKHGLQKHAITYQGHRVHMAKETCYDNLTFKFLEQCLLKLFNDPEKVKKIIQYIKSQRTRTQQYIIRAS